MWQMPDYELLESRRTLRHGLFDLTPSLIKIGVFLYSFRNKLNGLFGQLQLQNGLQRLVAIFG